MVTIFGGHPVSWGLGGCALRVVQGQYISNNQFGLLEIPPKLKCVGTLSRNYWYSKADIISQGCVETHLKSSGIFNITCRRCRLTFFTHCCSLKRTKHKKNLRYLEFAENNDII